MLVAIVAAAALVGPGPDQRRTLPRRGTQAGWKYLHQRGT